MISNAFTCTVLVAALAGHAAAVVVPVTVGDFEFMPSFVTINRGDTIQWQWQDGDHTSTAVSTSTEQWDVRITMSTPTFDYTFNNLGTFWYFCLPHGTDLTLQNPNADPPCVGMIGRITVVPAPGPLGAFAVCGVFAARSRRRAAAPRA